MKNVKIPPIAVMVIGVILCLAAVGGILYALILPTQTAIGAAQDKYNKAYPDSTPQAQEAARKQIDVAKAQVGQIKGQWVQISNHRMPRFDVSHRYQAWQQLINELTNNLEPDINHWLATTGVVPLNYVPISAPPTTANAVSGAPIIIPLAQDPNLGIQVGGDFRHILAHVQKWNDFNRLVLIDNLALQGTSPHMMAKYTATLFIFPQNDDKAEGPLNWMDNGATAAPTSGLAAGPGGPPIPGAPANIQTIRQNQPPPGAAPAGAASNNNG